MKEEDTVWNPSNAITSSKGLLESTKVLRALKIGEVKRIVGHGACSVGTGSPKGTCTMAQEIGRLRLKGWGLDYYHEKTGTLVVRRTK